MELSTGAMYSEVGVSFDVSHKVGKQIRHALLPVMQDYGIDNIEKDWILALNVSTRSTQTAVEIKGPSLDRRHKVITYSLCLPYFEIINSSNPLATYLFYYFDAVKEVFAKYNVPPDVINKAHKQVAKIVLDNEEYAWGQR